MTHAPKQRALEAYVSELLSDRATARIERHLAGCATCRDTLAALRAYAVLHEDASRTAPPVLDWKGLEAALPARAPAKARGKVLALSWPVLALAATFAVAWLGLSRRPANTPVARAPVATKSVVAPEEREVRGRVTLVSGSAELTLDAEPAPLHIDDEVREGSLLATGPDSALHVVLADGTGFALGPQTRLQVGTLNALATELQLIAGSVESQVHKLAQHERYEVLSGEYAVRVRGTHFVVERSADALSVFVHEGRVEVTKDGESVALLSPGEGYPSRNAAGETRPKARPIHDLAGFSLPRYTLQLPAMQQLRAWIVDGAQVTAQGELAMRLPPGPNELHFEDLRGQLRSVEIDVSAPWTSLSSSALSKLLAPATERTGYLPPERISQVIKGSLHALRRCYEHALRQSPSLEGKIVLAMRVAADGHVARAQAKGTSELPQPLARCLTQQARGMVFPKPEGDGAVSFEVPLNLKASR